MSRTSRTRAVAGTLLLTVSLGVAGCGLPGGGPDAEDAAKKLASAMGAGDVSDVPFSGDDAAAAKDFTAVTKASGAGRVRVGKVTEDGDRARATLSWKRPVGNRTWTYDSTVRLVKRAGSGGDKTWQVVWAPSAVEPSLKQGEVLSTTTLKARRGDILGADGSHLVTLRPVIRVGLDKDRVSAGVAEVSATRLARLLGVDPAGFAKQVRATGPRGFVQGIVYRRDEAPDEVISRLDAIPGARVIADQLPLAPTKEFGQGILGTVGPATAEDVKKSKGRIRAGDDVGLSGLEQRYDEQLAGTRGETVVAVDKEGTRRTLFTADPVAGKDLGTTIDPATENAAQQALGSVGPASALVAITPSTGRIVAVANGPGSKGYDTATYGRYAPGSTFKVVSTLALLRAGLRPDATVSCTPTLVVDGKRFKNYDDYPSSGLGRITFAEALANSCNTAFISQRDKVGRDGLAEAAAALGVGVDHDTGFPAYFGQVGTPTTETQAAASMIGQGSVLASPMAMAAVVASVVKGSAVVPTLFPDKTPEQQPAAKPLTAAEAQQVRTMMRGVVERGSGRVLQGVPGGPVIAKTGTAEFGNKPPLPTHAWMVAGRGDLAVAVFVDRGSSGSGTAGPILRRFLESVR